MMKKNRAALSPLLLFLCFLPLFFSSASSQTCRSYNFSPTSNSNNITYTSCLDLPYLGSFLHWNYNQSSGSAEIAFRLTTTSSSRWISWAINPTGHGMKGCQALVAFVDPATGLMRAYTSPITSYDTDMPEGSLSFGVPSISATFENGEMAIFAKIQLAVGTVTVNHLWQEGPMKKGKPATHSTGGANVRAKGTLDLVTGLSPVKGSGSTSSEQQRKNVHGVLNALSWGTLMPIGAIIARYLKVFKGADPAWFYLHVTCQASAYVMGVAGWITGLKLGDGGGETGYHGAIGAILFVGGTLQVLALLLRPKKDHKYRFFWNIYHHSIGYTVILLSIVNVFKGLDILDPSKAWKGIYIFILVILIIVAVVLEAVTWYIVIKRRRSSNSPKYPSNNFTAGASGHGNGPSHYGA